MKLLLHSIAYALFVVIVGALFFLYVDNIRLSSENKDLVWRNVTIEERKEPWKQRPVDQIAILKASQLTGIPFEVLLRARTKAENGGRAYEMGYRGKTQGVVENYDPHEWQLGEWARRMNAIIWDELLKTPEGGAVLIRSCEVYTGNGKKKAKEYANYLRGK